MTAQPGQEQTFPAYLKGLRAARGLTLRQVEAITGGKMSNQYLSQLEGGQAANPGATVLHALSAAYGVEVAELCATARRRPVKRPADPVRVRHAVVLASVVGLARASRQTGVSLSRLSEWRSALERATGERLPRRHDLKGRPRPFPLSVAQCAELAARRARGVSWGVLARLYRVSRTTCRRAAARAAAPVAP